MADIEAAARNSSGSTRTATGSSPPPSSSPPGPGGDWNVTDTVAEAIIGSRDLNGDKVLSFDEFWTYLNK